MRKLKDSIHELIVETATGLPDDVRRALTRAMEREAAGTPSALALQTIACNLDRARACRGVVCQDTGTPTFVVKAPASLDEMQLDEAISEAVADATREGVLRRTSIDPLTGRWSADNLGPGAPLVEFEQWLGDDVEIVLMLRGGACENAGTQYSLPCELPVVGTVERNLEGVRRCVLHAVHQIPGKGCSPGFLGVAIGGDRASGYALAKAQLLRSVDDTNADPSLARLEQEIVEQANALGIGSMGFGGAVSVLGCKVAAQARLPTSFFVTVTYDCWALRRQGVLLDGRTGAVKRWLYGTPSIAPVAGMPAAGRVMRLTTPLSADEVHALRVGDIVSLSGLVYTGREALHRHLLLQDVPLNLRGAAIYHCGVVAAKKNDAWAISAAGPSTSARVDAYQAEVLRRYGIRAVIGKGGMGAETQRALQECGAVYLHAVGGAAQYYASCIAKVEGVNFLELGAADAMWRLWVRDFPTIVTMDASGRSLHEQVKAKSARKLSQSLHP
jgi:fumarate hydratase class I